MEEEKDINLIKLSFDDSSSKIRRYDRRTIATVRSYFGQANFDRLFSQFGFKVLPEPVIAALEKYGYKYDYKLGGWATTTSGIIARFDEDEDNQVKANNIAMTKAKTKAYNKATKCVCEILKVFLDTFEMLESSAVNLMYIRNAEYDAYDNCVETGYCNPNFKE